LCASTLLWGCSSFDLGVRATLARSVTTVVFVPAPKGLVKEIASRFVCVLGFRRFSGYRNRNNRLTSSQEFSRCFAAGDCADHCRSEYGIAALEDTSSTKKGVESVGFR